MQTLNIFYYRSNNTWVGWLEQFPSYKIQGDNLEDLKKYLSDIYEDLIAGKIK
jgi:hypothetical protein